jgi:DNA-directed RNA polymerase subunit omega
MNNVLTSEDAVNQVGNRFDLVLIASRRVRELRNGWKPMVEVKESQPVVVALREVEAGLVGREYLLKNLNLDRRERSPESYK